MSFAFLRIVGGHNFMVCMRNGAAPISCRPDAFLSDRQLVLFSEMRFSAETKWCLLLHFLINF